MAVKHDISEECFIYRWDIFNILTWERLFGIVGILGDSYCGKRGLGSRVSICVSTLPYGRKVWLVTGGQG